MTNTFDSDEFTATDLRIALNEIYPEATYGAIPVIDQYDALKAYLAFDDGALADQGVREMQRPPRPDSNRRAPILPSKKFRKT